MNKFFVLLILLLVLTLSGCAKKTQETKREAIETADIYLSTGDCDRAFNALTKVGPFNDDAGYLVALSSAYACYSDFTIPIFYSRNIPKIKGTQQGLLGSLSTFSTSLMLSPTDSNYTSLQRGLDILLYAGELGAPSSAVRYNKFTTSDASDLNIFSLYMILTQLGKYLFFYGNADPIHGKKGKGTTANGNPNGFSNECFYDYHFSSSTVGQAFSAIVTAAKTANQLGSCKTGSTGSPVLVSPADKTTIKRICQGVTLFNNFLDILLNTELPTSIDILANIQTSFDTFMSSLPEGAGEIALVRSQKDCETVYKSGDNLDRLQFYYFLIFEKLFL